MEQIEFLEAAFEVAISGGVIVLTWPNGIRRAMPLNVFRICTARAVKALAEHDARKAEVIPLRSHAASS